MKKLFFGICLTLLLSSHVWAHEANTVNVETLAKTTSSWDGTTLTDYGQGQPEVTILRARASMAEVSGNPAASDGGDGWL